jgi:hypothetical protein
MIKYDWMEAGDNCYYYYDTSDGKVYGQVYNLAHTKIWGAKLFNERLLGHYVSNEFAKKALSAYYDIENKTFLE